MTDSIDDPDVARFMSFVEVLPSGCWFWTGARSRGKGNRKWYGSFRYRGQVIRAHRFACDVLGGRACPPGHHRDHTCGFSLCVRPDHIEIVTHARNQELKMERLLDPLRPNRSQVRPMHNAHVVDWLWWRLRCGLVVRREIMYRTGP